MLCKDCEYYFHTETYAKNWGECHANPPVIVFGTSGVISEELELRHYQVRPTVEDKDICRHFKEL